MKSSPIFSPPAGRCRFPFVCFWTATVYWTINYAAWSVLFTSTTTTLFTNYTYIDHDIFLWIQETGKLFFFRWVASQPTEEGASPENVLQRNKTKTGSYKPFIMYYVFLHCSDFLDLRYVSSQWLGPAAQTLPIFHPIPIYIHECFLARPRESSQSEPQAAQAYSLCYAIYTYTKILYGNFWIGWFIRLCMEIHSISQKYMILLWMIK